MSQMSEQEYRDLRCCMCPNLQKSNKVCPGISGTLHTEPSECRFVKSYVDARGWKYKVMGGIGQTYKARYQKPEKQGDSGWKGVASVPWRDNFDAAQTDLNLLAKEKGWKEWLE